MEPERVDLLAIGHGGGDDDGIGGSGHTGGEDGIGGSGYSGDGGDDGIGGSGLFGTVTGFGSICLNGQRIEYDDAVPVSYAGEDATSDALEIGQVVKVVTRDRQAVSIDIVFAVVGTVEKIEESSFSVMGQRVEPAEGSVVDHEALVVGGRVAVSGLRMPQGKIVASRVDPASARLRDSVATTDLEILFESQVDQIIVEGYVHSADAKGLDLGYVKIDSKKFAGIEASARLEVGARVRVRAVRAESGNFRAERVERLREVPLLRDFQRLDRERVNARPPRPARGPESIHPRRPQRPDAPSRPDYPRPNDRPRFKHRPHN